MHLPPIDVALFPLVSMSYGAPVRAPAVHQGRQSPEYDDVQKLVRHVVRSSRASLLQIERLRGIRHRVYLLRMTDGSQLVLKCSPTHGTRLLRLEQRYLENEAQVLELLNTHIQVPVPRRLKYDAQDDSLGSPVLLRSYIPGRPLAEIASHLSISERAQIDRSLGAYLRSISSIKASRFGPTNRAFSSAGSATWREAFLSLLESALRDAEDMLVSLPYDSIRYYVGAHSALLNDVREPQLVALDAGDPSKVLVDECSKRVTGLLGFGNVVWGDPLMASVFATASGALWEGFGRCLARGGSESVRQLLYVVYRAVVAIVTHYCRPQYNGKELEARRSLTWALNQLAGSS